VDCIWYFWEIDFVRHLLGENSRHALPTNIEMFRIGWNTKPQNDNWDTLGKGKEKCI
jgi:hypothetical protein